MADTALDTDELARLAVGGRAMKRRRMSRRMLARLLGEKSEAAEDYDDDEEISDEAGEKDARIARLLIGSRLLRRARLRKLLLAHLLRERDEAEDDDEISDDDSSESGEGKERQIAKLLIASGALRRRRTRRMILAHLMRERGEAEGEDEDSDDEFAEGGEDRDKQIAKLLIATGVLRRRRTRRMLLGHLARERREGEDED